MELYGTAIDILWNHSGISILVTEYFMIRMYVGMCLLLLLCKPTISCDKWYYKSNTQNLTEEYKLSELSFKNFWKAFFNFMRRLQRLA